VTAFAVHVRGFLHRFALRAAVFLAFANIATTVRVCALCLIGHLDLLLSFSCRCGFSLLLALWELAENSRVILMECGDVVGLKTAQPVRVEHGWLGRHPIFFLLAFPAPSRESPTANGSRWYAHVGSPLPQLTSNTGFFKL